MINPTPPPLQFEPPSPPERPPDSVVDQMLVQDRRHLDRLVSYYNIAAGLVLIVGIIQGALMALGPKTGPLRTKVLGWRVSFPDHLELNSVGMPAARSDVRMWTYGATLVLAGLLMAVVLRWVAQGLEKREGRVYCQVIAVLVCFTGWMGVILGIVTLMVLDRPGVVWLFGKKG